MCFPSSHTLLAEPHSHDCIYMLGAPAKRALPRAQKENETS